jgi:hypothetical protein
VAAIIIVLFTDKIDGNALLFAAADTLGLRMLTQRKRQLRAAPIAGRPIAVSYPEFPVRARFIAIEDARLRLPPHLIVQIEKTGALFEDLSS